MLFSATVSYATPPSAPFAAGSTLDPNCAPGSSNCTVAVSQWTTNGGNLSFSGAVGIGTSSPSVALDVNGSGILNAVTLRGNGASGPVVAPTNVQATVNYAETGQLNANNYTYNFRVYSYRIVSSVKVFSSTYATLSAPVTDNNSGTHYAVDLSWTAASGAVGYRIIPSLVQGSTTLINYDYYIDTTATSMNDVVGQVNPGNTVTPVDTTTYTGTTLTVNGNSQFNNAIAVAGTATFNGSAVINSDVLFSSYILAHGATGVVPDLGSGNRFSWDPSKSALRAGGVDGLQWNTVNVGNYSVATGYSTTASATGSTAMGQYTSATNSGATALGYNSVASGGFSTSIGNFTKAESFLDIAIGLFNVGGGNPNTIVSTDPLFEVGNGTDDAHRANALTILKNGNVGIKALVPSYLLQVGDSAVTGVVARFQNSTGTCDINPTTSSLVCSSDMNLKQNITNLSDNSSWNFNTNIAPTNQTAFAKLVALNPVAYNWRTEPDTAAKHPGFIAQEVQEVFPELVATDPKTNLLSLNYTGLIPYTVEAIKEINLSVVNIADLAKSNPWRDSLIGWFANTENGIKSLVVHDKICVDDQCLTKNDVRNLLQMEQNQHFSGGTSIPAPVDSISAETQTPAIDPVEVSTPTDAPADQSANTETVPDNAAL